MMAAVGFCSSPSSLLFLFLNKLFRDKTRRDEERYEKRVNSFLGFGKHLNISKCDAVLFVVGLVCENAKET